ncbi:unnamed protein product [Thelazia callipaeda]|uniref:PCM1_C domain-containing protein n=1 Tax=Thelazia callipaeda TaxID=103827 RepID=A0A0N5DB74_THECL|nr:unnamed protein product [Thelazia callipaeda]
MHFEQRTIVERLRSEHSESLLNETAQSQSKVATLRKCILAASPQLLMHFANILLDVAKGQAPVCELDSVLVLLQYPVEERISGQAIGHRSDASNGDCKTSTQSKASEATMVHAHLTSRSDCDLNRELTTEKALKFELAKQQLSTGEAKLRKQQTLEKIRTRTRVINDDQKQFPKTNSTKDLENSICMLIDGILPWVGQQSELIADDQLMKQLRERLLQQASVICFPKNAAYSDLFCKQLSTIFDSTLSQYVGSKLAEVSEVLIFDVSEVLYNELACFQLINSTNSSAI